MATINHKKYDEATETFKDFSVYDGKETLIFKVDGSEGKVGIGTDLPTYSLQVSKAGDSVIAAIDTTGNSISALNLGNSTNLADGGIRYDNSADALILRANNAEQMRIDSSGNVGIGTASPSVALEVDGAVKFSTSGAGGPDLSFGNIGGSTFINNIASARNYYGAFEHVFTNTDNSIERVRIDSSGNVGIGTSSPTAKLDVVGAAQLSSDLFMGNNQFLRFVRNSGNLSVQTLGIPSGTDDVRLVTTGDFNVVSGTLTNLLTVKSSGNVGIGTASPANIGAAYTHLAISGATTGVLSIQSGTNRIFSLASIGDDGLLENRTATGSLKFRLATGTTEICAVTPNGLTFNGDTAAANALDDYEEGTWTPVIRGSGTAGTYEFGSQKSNYTKIGRQVTLNCNIVLNSSITGGGSGYVQITGLPFTKGADQEAVGSCWFLGIDFTGSWIVPRFVSQSPSSTLYFIETVDNANPIDMPISGIAASDVINFSITYFV